MKKKPSVKKCSCYGGFDCPGCNPRKYKQPAAKNANDWLTEILRETSGASDDPVPAGWMTESEMRERAGVGHPTMHNRIGKLIRDQKLQRKKFKVIIAGRRTAVWHYYPTT